MTTNVQRCIDLYKGGTPITDIAAALGIKYVTVTSNLTRARQQGRLPAIERRYVPKASRPVGRMSQVLDRLPPEIYDWLVDQTPDGMTLSEAAGAIITDAYYEENPMTEEDQA